MRLAKYGGLSIATALLLLSGATPSRSEEKPGCPIEELTAEFQTLRAIRGHFGGGAWSDDADRWNGRKHQVMVQLGSCLGTGQYSKSEIIRWMGEPDKIAVKGDFLFSMVNSDRTRKLAADSELLIYYWRGGHDFLYFTCMGESAINSSWWFAGE